MSFSSNTHRQQLLIWAVAAVCFSLLPTSASAQEAVQWASGKMLYDKVCGHCHKPEVGVGTLLEGRELPPAYVTTIVRNGFNAMPAFPASYIDDKSLALVAEYLSSLPAPTTQP